MTSKLWFIKKFNSTKHEKKKKKFSCLCRDNIWFELSHSLDLLTWKIVCQFDVHWQWIFFPFFVCVRSGWWKLVYFVPNMFCLKSFPSSWKSKWNVWLFHYCVDVVAIVFFWFHLNCPCYNLLWGERTDQTSECIGSRHVLILLWSLLIIRNWGKDWLNKKK